jgi:hypothetical protein
MTRKTKGLTPRQKRELALDVAAEEKLAAQLVSLIARAEFLNDTGGVKR